MPGDIDFSFGPRPEPQKRWKFWRVVPVPKLGAQVFRPLCEAVPVIKCHFDQTTRVCFRTNCPHCAAGIPQRMVGFMPAYDVAAKARVVLMLPETTVSMIQLMSKAVTSLTSSQIVMTRRSNESIGQVVVKSIQPLSEILDVGQWRGVNLDIAGSMESVLRVIGVPADTILETAATMYTNMTIASVDQALQSLPDNPTVPAPTPTLPAAKRRRLHDPVGGGEGTEN